MNRCVRCDLFQASEFSRFALPTAQVEFPHKENPNEITYQE